MYICIRWFIQLQLLTIRILLHSEKALFVMPQVRNPLGVVCGFG